MNNGESFSCATHVTLNSHVGKLYSTQVKCHVDYGKKNVMFGLFYVTKHSLGKKSDNELFKVRVNIVNKATTGSVKVMKLPKIVTSKVQKKSANAWYFKIKHL